MKINKKYIITGTLMVLTLILTICLAINVKAANIDIVDDEKTMVRMVTALSKGSDSITTTNLQNGLNKYAGNGVASVGTKIGNVIPITFTATGNIYEIDINNGAAFDDSSGGQVYTITYDANGGTGAPEAQTKTVGTTITLSTTEPTRTGYTFLGWSTNSSATTAEYQPGGIFTENSNTTLYAVWTSTTVTLKLYPNGGIFSYGREFLSASTTIGENISLPTTSDTASIPTRTGYTFLGYSESATATTVQYMPGQTIQITKDLVLYAVWQKNGSVAYVLTFNPNGGAFNGMATNVVKTQTLNRGDAILTDVPTRAGYTFLGWSTSSSATTAAIQPGDSFGASNNMTIYAVWE